MADLKSVRAEFRKRFGLSFLLFLGVLGAGTLGFKTLAGKGHSLVDCLYMTVITVSTVGYGEVIDLSGNPAGRMFAVVLIFAGMGIILYFVSNVTAFLMDGTLRNIFRRKKMREMIEKMNGHYIICGAGTMGAHAVDELHRTGHQSVVIDADEARTSDIRERYPGVGVIQGDASENDILEAAGIGRAKGILAATNSDKDNLVITLTARQMRRDIRVVSRCSQMNHKEKFLRSGANSVVPMNFIGGMRMASEMIRPAVVTFLDRMLREGEGSLRIEEVCVPKGSSLDGIVVSEVRKAAVVLAVLCEDDKYIFNPPDTYTVTGGQTIIMMGTSKDRKKLESLVAT